MDRRILKSVLSLLVIFAIGGGATYALTTNGQATITNNQLSASSGDLKLCDEEGTNDWRKSIEGNLDADGLAPGGAAVELTADRDIWIGNDDGTLDDNEPPTGCDSYEDEEGDSTVALDIFPTVSYETETCAHPERFELSFAYVGEGAATPFHSLNEWADNDSVQINGPVDDGESEELIVNARLDDSAVSSDTCKFDIHFTGIQDNTPE